AAIRCYRAYVGAPPSGPARRHSRAPSDLPGRDTTRRGLPERVGINLPRVLEKPKFRDNIMRAGGDSMHILEYHPIVLVQGAVNSPGAVAYTPGKNLDWYVDQA